MGQTSNVNENHSVLFPVVRKICLPYLAPANDWCNGLGKIPNNNTPVIIEYLITGRAVTSDGGQMDAFRSKKGENFYAEKYVHDYKHNNSIAGLCYISAKVHASMKKEKYRVELCVQKPL